MIFLDLLHLLLPSGKISNLTIRDPQEVVFGGANLCSLINIIYVQEVIEILVFIY